MNEEFAKEFITQAIYRINENTPKIVSCMSELGEDEIWKRPNNVSNSIGNLVLHLCGNITQYIISSLSEAEDTRERDKEFSTNGGYLKSELINKLKATVEKAITVIQNMDVP